jgi:hypothetical protein
MCVQCVTGGFAAYEAAVCIGGPIAYAGYRRVRAALGRPDTAVAPLPPKRPEVRAGPQSETARWAPVATRRSIASTTAGLN